MWRDVDGDDALGIDMLVRVGGDVHDVMIWKDVRHSRSHLADNRIDELLPWEWQAARQIQNLEQAA